MQESAIDDATTPMARKETTTPTIQVLERSFALLDVLAQQPEPMALKDISERTGLHPSTAHRILNDLAAGRFVERPQAGLYRLGMRLLELGNLVKARLSVREAALAPMRELHRLTNQAVNLSVRQGDEIVYVERAYSERSGMQVVRAVGGRAPLHLTSVGKLFLADDDPQRVRAYATRTGLVGNTRNSITDLPRLERELELARANYRKYAENLEQARIDQELEVAKISSLNVMQPPSLSITPISPQPLATLALGAAASILAAVAVALFAERRRERLLVMAPLSAPALREPPPGLTARPRRSGTPACAS